MEIPIRQEVQNVLDAMEGASDGEMMRVVRAVLLRHSVFEELVDSGAQQNKGISRHTENFYSQIF